MLNSDDPSYIRQCFDDIAADVEEPITFRQYKNVTPGDQNMGTPDKPNYDDLPITATVRELTLEEVTVSGGAYVLGDVEVKIRQTVLASQPAYKDRIVCTGNTYKPKSISHSYLGGTIGWTIRAGK